MKLRKLLLLTLLLFGLALTACRPDYPKCDNDEDCVANDKGKAEGRLVCLNGLCQQCRSTSDCAGEGMTCRAGLCERISGYCSSDAQCMNGQKCRNNICSSECVADNECGDGKECKAGRCEEKIECTAVADCGDGKDCVQGKCVSSTASKAACDLETIHFDYNSSILTDRVQSELQQAGECIKAKNVRVRLEGNTDERGTAEYNLALGERRARSAYSYLVKMGVKPDLLSTISYGKENLLTYCGEDGPDSCHRKNRRVVFDIR